MCVQTLRNDRSEVQRFKKSKETLSEAIEECIVLSLSVCVSSDGQDQRWFHRVTDQSPVEGKECG